MTKIWVEIMYHLKRLMLLKIEYLNCKDLSYIATRNIVNSK